MPVDAPPPPFLDPEALRADAEARQRRDQPPRSPLAALLGGRVDAATLGGIEQHADLPPEVLHRIAAWPVMPLLGATLELVDLEEAASGLHRLLCTHAPGVAWQVPDDLAGPLHKYLILHTSLAAASNDTVPEPMALEVYAACVSVDGVRLDSAEGDTWRREVLARDTRHGGGLHALGRLRFELRAATWANVSYPGVGVPFYL